MLFEAWDDVLRNTCGRYHAVPQDRRCVVAGHFLRRRLSSLDVADFSCDVSEIYRTRQDVRLDEAEHFYLLVQMAGSTKAEQGGERAILLPGQLYLLDSRQPVNLRFDGVKSHCFSVHLPRALLLAEAESPLRTGLCADHSSAEARRLREHVVARMSSRSFDTKPDPTHMLDLARTAFAADKEVARPLFRRASQSSRYEYAIREMEFHLTCPELSLTWLAQRIGVSSRQLERDFQAHAESFVSCLREKRLRLTCELVNMARRAGQEVRITDIAFAAGFRDLSNFNRAFRSKFNQTPSDYLRSGVVNHSGITGGSNFQARWSHHEQDDEQIQSRDG